VAEGVADIADRSRNAQHLESRAWRLENLERLPRRARLPAITHSGLV
jgi:hypothetical protein